MNGDAVVAEGNGANNWLSWEWAATATQPVFQPFNAKNRAAAGISSGCAALAAEIASDFFVAGGFGAGFLLQPHFLAQSIGHLMDRDPTKSQRSQQVINTGEVAAACHSENGVTAEQGIEAIAAQLALQHFAAACDVVVAVAALVPLADALTGRWRGHKIQPIEAGVGCFGSDDLNEVAVLQRGGKWAEAIVNSHALAVISNLAVYPVRKVHSCGAFA